MKNVGNSSHGLSQGVPKILRAPMYRVHCAAIFAIAQLSWFTCDRSFTLPLPDNRCGTCASRGVVVHRTDSKVIGDLVWLTVERSVYSVMCILQSGVTQTVDAAWLKVDYH